YRPQLLIEACDLYVTHNSDDGNCRGFNAAVFQAAADRAASLEQAIGHGLADDHHRGVGGFVSRIKLSTLNERHLKSLKISVTDRANVSFQLLARWRKGFAFDVNARGVARLERQ